MGVLVQGGAVSFDEINDSPTYNVGRDIREANRHGIISWSSIDSAIAELFPPAPALPGVFPGVSSLYAESAEFSPFHPDGVPTLVTTATYSQARAKIKYSTKLYDPSDLFVRRYSFSGEFLTLPAGGLYWDDLGTVVEQEEISAAKIVPMTEHSLTKHRVTSIPWTAITRNIGRVNKTTLNNAFFSNIPPECLLFVGAEINFTLSTDGSTVWTIEYRFQERRVDLFEETSSSGATGIGGWNHFLRNSDTPKWAKIILGPHNPLFGDDYVYSYAPSNFTDLIA